MRDVSIHHVPPTLRPMGNKVSGNVRPLRRRARWQARLRLFPQQAPPRPGQPEGVGRLRGNRTHDRNAGPLGLPAGPTRWAYPLGYDVKLVKRKRIGEEAAAEEAEWEKWVADGDGSVATEIRVCKDDMLMMENRVRDMEELISAYKETY